MLTTTEKEEIHEEVKKLIDSKYNLDKRVSSKDEQMNFVEPVVLKKIKI